MKHLLLAFFILISSIHSYASPANTEVAKSETSEASGIEKSFSADEAAKRATYMKWHKRFSFLTLGLVVGAIGTHREQKEARESHKIYGMAAAGAFFASTYFAMAAPKLEGQKEKRSQKLHRWLGYAAIPLMILLPLSGIDADNDYKDGHDADGIGEMKGALSSLTIATLIGSTALAYFEF